MNEFSKIQKNNSHPNSQNAQNITVILLICNIIIIDIFKNTMMDLASSTKNSSAINQILKVL